MSSASPSSTWSATYLNSRFHLVLVVPTIRLSKSTIDGLPVPPKDVVFWDDSLPGFGVKVTPKGKKVFIALYRTGGAGSRLRKYTIGPYGRITLHGARAEAQKVFAAKLDGRARSELWRDLRQPDRRLDRLDLAEERANALPVGFSAVFQQPRRLRRDEPLISVWQVAPRLDVGPNLVDDRRRVVFLLVR